MHPTGLGRGGINNNSPTYAGRIRVNILGNSDAQALQLVLTNLENNAPNTTINGTSPAGYRPFDVPGGTDPTRFNFRDFTPAIPAVEKAMYYVTGRYKVFGEGLQLYGDLLYAKTKQDNGLAGAPFALPGAVARSSPFDPFPTVTHINPVTGAVVVDNGVTQLRYRLQQELGDRRSFFDSDYWRYVAGVNGDFNFKDNGFISHFGYDSGFVFERYDNQRIDSGDAQFTPLAAEIAAGNFNPYIGQFAPPIGVAPIYNAAGVQIGTRPYDNVAAAQRASYLGHSFFYEADWAR